MVPHCVAASSTHRNANTAPEFFRGVDTRCVDVDANNLFEHVVCGSAGSAAALPGFVHNGGGGHAFAHGFRDYKINPAFNESQQCFQAADGGGVVGGDAWG